MGGGLQWACDISASAVKTFNRNFTDAQVGNIEDCSLWVNLQGTDVITAGFPCQRFSGAGACEGLNDPRGSVIHHIVEKYRAIRPPFLVLEC
eukprot:13667673-Heterocapsa_arctica.AAC.1